MAQLGAAIGDIFQVRVKGFIEGQETNNVMHFKSVTVATDVESDLILMVINCFVTHLLPALSVNWHLDQVVWKRVSPTLSPEFITVPTGPATGTAIGDSLPTFNAALISIRTAEGGRSKRGRMFLAGLPESATLKSSFNLTGPEWAAILAFVACMIQIFIDSEPIGAGIFRLGVYSRKIGGAAFPYGATGFTPAIQLSPVALIATMRSRKVGRGS